MSRPPIPFKSAEGPIEIDPVHRTPSSVPSEEKTSSRLTPERFTINDIYANDDALTAFNAEDDLTEAASRRSGVRRPGGIAILVASLVVAGILGLTFVALNRQQPAAVTPNGAPVGTGLAQFDSRPSGAEVVIDGVARGKTPLKLSLPVGDHTLEVRNETGTRTLPLSIEAGTVASQYVELQPAAAVSSTGRLDVSSDPPGAQVKIDGVAKGNTPLTLESVEPGEHSVALSRNGVTILRTVKVAPGTTGSVMASLGAAAAAVPGAIGGWISLRAPFELQVFENGQLIGTSNTDRLMVTAGKHQLDLVSNALQFRSTVAVDVQAGKVTSTPVTVPNGSLSVNALPWADVSIDGQATGTTPLANLAVPIGTHELVLHHPQLGERRRTVTITTQGPVRVGVDFAQ